MKTAKKALPAIFALLFVSGLSYCLFSVYEPDSVSQVKGARVEKDKRDYLSTIPLPSGSKEKGRTVRDNFSQVTASTQKTSEEVQKFYKSVLVSKGWKAEDEGVDLLSTLYLRDQGKIEVSVLSIDSENGTVFSISHSD